MTFASRTGAKVVISIGLSDFDFKDYLARIGPGRECPERPGECPFCDGQVVWFDGWRIVFCLLLAEGTPHRFDDGLPLKRVCCALCWRSWTLRPRFLYPHRLFQPDIAEAAAAAYLSDPTATYEKKAKAFGCSARSIWRWVGGCATVAGVADLVAAVERLSGAGQSPHLIPRTVPESHPKARSDRRAKILLTALQVLVTLTLWSRAQPVPPLDPSPLRFFLHERFRTFRCVELLVPRSLSPPLPVPEPTSPAV